MASTVSGTGFVKCQRLRRDADDDFPNWNAYQLAGGLWIKDAVLRFLDNFMIAAKAGLPVMDIINNRGTDDSPTEALEGVIEEYKSRLKSEANSPTYDNEIQQANERERIEQEEWDRRSESW